MVNLSYSIQKNKEKMYIKTYAILCVLILLSMGFYSYQNWQKYAVVKEASAKNKELINILKTKDSEEKTSYENKKSSYNDLSKEIDEKLAYIFPPTDNYTALTRQIDSFEEKLSKKNNPFEIANIDYQDVVIGETYSVLPFRMSIRSSSDNFTKFLHLVENSGALSDQIRLMDISSISLNFEGSGEESSTQNEIISFTVQINAYFQK